MTFTEFTSALHPLAGITAGGGPIFTEDQLGAVTYAAYAHSVVPVPAADLPNLLARLVARDLAPQALPSGGYAVALAPGVTATVLPTDAPGAAGAVTVALVNSPLHAGLKEHMTAVWDTLPAEVRAGFRSLKTAVLDAINDGQLDEVPLLIAGAVVPAELESVRQALLELATTPSN